MFLHADSEDSNQTQWMDAQTDLSLRCAHISFCWFCLSAAHMIRSRTQYCRWSVLQTAIIPPVLYSDVLCAIFWGD